MRPRARNLSAVTRTDRHEAISAIDDAVSSADGWMVGHTLFSNISAAFRVALPGNRLAAFGDKLSAAGIRLDQASLDIVAEPEDSDKEIGVALSVTFIHNEPDLKHVIPAIPG